MIQIEPQLLIVIVVVITLICILVMIQVNKCKQVSEYESFTDTKVPGYESYTDTKVPGYESYTNKVYDYNKLSDYSNNDIIGYVFQPQAGPLNYNVNFDGPCTRNSCVTIYKNEPFLLYNTKYIPTCN